MAEGLLGVYREVKAEDGSNAVPAKSNQVERASQF